MGMVLSAVGACLLFVLKAVGILLLILLVLAALLLLCPFCADVYWQNDTLTVKAGALGITFPVFQYPKPEPPAQPEEPKGFTGRLKAKFRAWRAERKRKKAKKKADIQADKECENNCFCEHDLNKSKLNKLEHDKLTKEEYKRKQLRNAFIMSEVLSEPMCKKRHKR